MSSKQLKELSEYCRDKGVAFSSTPYSEEEVDFLVEECNVPYIKIASMEINNLRFLKYIGSKHIPIILSTGMATFEEVDEAVKTLKKSGAEQLVLLHCVSIYPTVLSDVNLNNIIGLRERYPEYPIGFSDHTEGDAACVAAVALGACVIEKHLTLDRTKVGMDNGMATEPDQFKILIEKCRNIQIAIGSKDRTVSQKELEQRKNMRRSLVTVRDIKAGEPITENDLYAKRPGTGIAPTMENEVVGKKAIKDIPADTVILPEDIN